MDIFLWNVMRSMSTCISANRAFTIGTSLWYAQKCAKQHKTTTRRRVSSRAATKSINLTWYQYYSTWSELYAEQMSCSQTDNFDWIVLYIKVGSILRAPPSLIWNIPFKIDLKWLPNLCFREEARGLKRIEIVRLGAPLNLINPKTADRISLDETKIDL